ncbi:uncharacterized protein LOC136085969 [Hydra vulgaris]|uniref:Uncharacterized protein LOC136085969 n=1 Tax=Hydra vulgaris TaxID=6087 RepID=A0ABM4CQH7_HYDVU
MLGICIEEYLPSKYDSDADQNRSEYSFYRKYNDKTSIYLIIRPRPLVKHCMKMIVKLQGIDLQEISAVNKRLYYVASFQSNNREIYQCYLGDAEQLPSCTFFAWFTIAYPCKHFFAIFMKENLTWFDFGTSYRNSPYFILDQSSDEFQPLISIHCKNLLNSNILFQNNRFEDTKPLVGFQLSEKSQTDQSCMSSKSPISAHEVHSKVQVIHHTP